MWDTDLEDVSISVVKRISLTFNKIDSYFNIKETQMLPKDGYTAIFDNIFDHQNISLFLNTKFDKNMQKDAYYCFNSMSIDEYFDYSEGELPYRSIKFYHKNVISNAIDNLAQTDGAALPLTASRMAGGGDQAVMVVSSVAKGVAFVLSAAAATTVRTSASPLAAHIAR
jgi:hypothetical protein